jgi:hypothetical protein
VDRVAKPITDAYAIERRLLELAYTTDAKLTATALAYFAPCSIDDATKVLDDLAARDRLRLEIEDDGTVVYELPGRQKLGAPQPSREPHALAPIDRPHRHVSPALAALITLFVPGAGHIYAGRAIAGVLWFFLVSMAYGLILPGLVLHLVAIGSAAGAAQRANYDQHLLPTPRQLLLR